MPRWLDDTVVDVRVEGRESLVGFAGLVLRAERGVVVRAPGLRVYERLPEGWSDGCGDDQI